LCHNKSASLLIEGVNDIIKGVETDKEYDLEAFYSRCCSKLLNEEKCWLTTTFSSKYWSQILLKDGPQMQTIGNWYINIELLKGK
jgi:hypothetical protein